MKNIKLIVTDLDNTLLRRDKTISEYTKSVFGRLREKGILTAFATSRSARASERFRKIIKLDIDITSGGAIAVMNGTTLFRAAIDIETANRILYDLHTNEGILQITADTEKYYFNSKMIDKSWAGWIDYADAVVTDFSKPLEEADVFKITTQAVSAEIIEKIISCYPDIDMLHFTGEDWYQIKARKASKQNAIAAVCNKLGLSMSKVVAFGDDYNDVGMLRECGTGVAMSNAIDEVKNAADHICGDCDDDGAAKWIEENIL